MSDIQTCLATFAVAAFANNEISLEMGRQAIVDYLAATAQDPVSQRAALVDLDHDYAKLKLDSAAAIAIRADIASRIGDIDIAGLNAPPAAP